MLRIFFFAHSSQGHEYDEFLTFRCLKHCLYIVIWWIGINSDNVQCRNRSLKIVNLKLLLDICISKNCAKSVNDELMTLSIYTCMDNGWDTILQYYTVHEVCFQIRCRECPQKSLECLISYRFVTIFINLFSLIFSHHRYL